MRTLPASPRPLRRDLRPVLRMVSQPFAPDQAGRARFGFFANAFHVRKPHRLSARLHSH